MTGRPSPTSIEAMHDLVAGFVETASRPMVDGVQAGLHTITVAREDLPTLRALEIKLSREADEVSRYRDRARR